MRRENKDRTRSFGSGKSRDGARRFDDNPQRSFGHSRFDNDFRGGFNSNRSFSTPREMHKAICAECKNECEVPFKPTEGKPVYCRACFAKRRPANF